MTHPAYETLRRVSPIASVLLQDNAGPMTLDGTNTWLLRAPDSSSVVVVDPGQTDDAHLDNLLAVAPEISLVLLTHGHHDHSESAAALHERAGVAVRAIDPAHCHGAGALEHGQTFEVSGVRVSVLATPGHTADSASFVLDGVPDVGAAVLTGDTILGRGTTVVAHPDGQLGAYLESLQLLRGLGAITVLPGHGPELPAAEQVAGFYLAHRQERLNQVRTALASLGPTATARQIVEVVYADVDESVWWAADLSVEAQLKYLRDGV
ncbi:MAG TPA: MBL fold metallo-hydrolase [Jatrophihabitans sp.]|uniref:MBL fold metallo-hydrolase n=1 Tax=Jatrophihabitans sp. TaxID=1932789 RepID=UPI002E024D74|nr:MBL fold metallo-hydrolase [Jatrophihabitans sp.]